MSFRKPIALLVVVALVLASVPQSAVASTVPRTLSGADMHRTVQAHRSQVVVAHATMQALLGRADVQDQIRKFGLNPQAVSARVARLSDAEILRLEGQVMQTQMRGETAGLSGGAIAAIAVGGSLLLIGLLVLLVWAAAEDLDDGYYY